MIFCSMDRQSNIQTDKQNQCYPISSKFRHFHILKRNKSAICPTDQEYLHPQPFHTILVWQTTKLLTLKFPIKSQLTNYLCTMYKYGCEIFMPGIFSVWPDWAIYWTFFKKWAIPGLFSFIFVFSIHSWQ